jgi:hypothetical protein
LRLSILPEGRSGIDSTINHEAGTIYGGSVSESRIRISLAWRRAETARGPSNINSQALLVISVLASLDNGRISASSLKRCRIGSDVSSTYSASVKTDISLLLKGPDFGNTTKAC